MVALYGHNGIILEKMDIVIAIILILLINSVIIKFISTRYDFNPGNFPWLLFLFHVIVTVFYIFYTSDSNSDSWSYYIVPHGRDDWFSMYESGTKFISFLAWPLIQIFGFSFLSNMIVFSYFGYLGILLFYLTAKENAKLNTPKNKMGPIELVFLLPNLHFWTSSLGKGSMSLFAIGLFAFGLSRFNRRIPWMLLGSYVIYMIRPHILLAVVIGILIGIFLTNVGIKPVFKWLIFILSLLIFSYLSESVLKFTDTDSLNFTTSSTFSHRTAELSKATSGVDIQNYNQLEKVLTFWFRPLFFDQLGAFGLIASIENACYIFMFFTVIQRLFLNWSKFNGLFKIFLFSFILGSVVLAQVSGNLGIALRQKTQFMPFLFVLYFKALTFKKKYQ